MKPLGFSILPADNSHYNNLTNMIFTMYKEEDNCDDMTPEKAEKIIHFLFSHPECGQIFIVQQTKTSQIVGCRVCPTTSFYRGSLYSPRFSKPGTRQYLYGFHFRFWKKERGSSDS